MNTVEISKIFYCYNGLASSNVEVFEIKDINLIPYHRPSKSIFGTIAGYVDQSKINKKHIYKNVIAVSTDGEGSHTYSYYINYDFVPNSNVLVLKPKEKMSSLQLKIYASLISKNRYRFQYGRKPKGKRITEIKVPTLEEVNNLIKVNELNDDLKISSDSIIHDFFDLDFNTFKPFLIKELFNVYSGGDKPKDDDLNNINYVNSIENLTTNNGINGKISYNGKNIFKNFISIVSIGEGGTAFYQKELSAIFTRVKALVPKKETILNKYTAMFLISILNKERYKYSYGRVVSLDKIKETKIYLPTDSMGQPNWELIERYIKSLNYTNFLLLEEEADLLKSIKKNKTISIDELLNEIKKQ